MLLWAITAETSVVLLIEGIQSRILGATTRVVIKEEISSDAMPPLS